MTPSPLRFAPQRGVSCNSLMIDMTNEAYHGDTSRLGSTMLKRMLISPGHFRAALAHCAPDKSHFAFGRAVHAAILEPAEYERMYAVFPLYGCDTRSRELKDFVGARPHQIVIRQADHDEHMHVRDAVWAATFRGRPLKDWIAESRCEATIAFDDPDTGVPCKVRPDALHPDFVFDLKTANDIRPEDFSRLAVSYGYDLQAHMYSLGASAFSGTRRPFVFIVVEKTAPYSVITYVSGETFMENGAAKYQEAISLYKACRDTDYWPGIQGEYTLEISPYQAYTPERAKWLQA